MKYETPEVTSLTPAINAIQGSDSPLKLIPGTGHNPYPAPNEAVSAYEDWE